MKTYIISKDYSPLTGLRYCNRSDHSGEDFYHQKLNGWFKEAYETKEQMKIILDGGEDGYGPSFLDESFGNLVYDFSLVEVKKWLVIDSTIEPDWQEAIENETFPAWQELRDSGKRPIKTENHTAWYRLEDGELKQKIWLQPDKK